MFRPSMFASIALAALFASTAGATTLADIEQLVEEKWAEVSSFRANISVNVKVPMGSIEVPANAEGTIELMAADGGRKYRLGITNHVAKNFVMRDGLTQEVLTVFDGEYAFTETTVFGRKQVTKQVNDAANTNQPIGGSAIFDRLRKQGDVTLAGDTTIDGTAVWMIDVKGNGKPIEVQAPIKPSRMRVFIAQESGLQVRVLMFDKKNKEIMRMLYTNVQLNPELDAARFQYTPPPGVKVKEVESPK